MTQPIPRTDLECLRDWLLDTLQHAVLRRSRKRRLRRASPAWGGPYAFPLRFEVPADPGRLTTALEPGMAGLFGAEFKAREPIAIPDHPAYDTLTAGLGPGLVQRVKEPWT